MGLLIKGKNLTLFFFPKNRGERFILETVTPRWSAITLNVRLSYQQWIKLSLQGSSARDSVVVCLFDCF